MWNPVKELKDVGIRFNILQPPGVESGEGIERLRSSRSGLRQSSVESGEGIESLT